MTIVERTTGVVGAENRVELAVPALHPLDLDLGNGHASEPVSLDVLNASGAVAESMWFELDDAGRAKLDLVPAGRYRLHVGGTQHEIRVPETRTFKL